MAGRHGKKFDTKTTGKNELDPKRRQRRRVIMWSSIGAAVLIAGAGVSYALHRPLTADPGASLTPKVTQQIEQGRLTFLLIGTDARPGETGGNTDVLMLASIDMKNKRIEIMSIPRDTKVMFPDGSNHKINESYALGGPNMTTNLVYGLTNIPINFYAVTHFGGLVDVINTLGGIRIDVPEPMHYNTGDKQYNIIDLNTGWQTLTGEQALGFVRFRMDALGDIGRTKRQQDFMVALYQKLMQPDNLTKLPSLINEFSSTISTDMSASDLIGLADRAGEFKNYQIIHETMPGAFHSPTGPTDASYWIVNSAETQWAANQFFHKGIVQPNIIQTEQYVQSWTPPVYSSTTGGSGSTNGTGNTTNNTGAAATSSPGLGNSTSGSSTAAGGNTVTNVTGATGMTGQTTGTTPQQMVVSVNSAFIRSGPGSNYNVVASVLKGSVIDVLGQDGSWDKVSVGNGQYGYIANWLLQPKQ